MTLLPQVILFGLLFGGSRRTDLTDTEFQVTLTVLGIFLAFNIYCAIVIAHWRKNICEEMQIANTPFQALAWLSPTDHQRRGQYTTISLGSSNHLTQHCLC